MSSDIGFSRYYVPQPTGGHGSALVEPPIGSLPTDPEPSSQTFMTFAGIRSSGVVHPTPDPATADSSGSGVQAGAVTVHVPADVAAGDLLLLVSAGMRATLWTQASGPTLNWLGGTFGTSYSDDLTYDDGFFAFSMHQNQRFNVMSAADAGQDMVFDVWSGDPTITDYLPSLHWALLHFTAASCPADIVSPPGATYYGVLPKNGYKAVVAGASELHSDQISWGTVDYHWWDDFGGGSGDPPVPKAVLPGFNTVMYTWGLEDNSVPGGGPVDYTGVYDPSLYHNYSYSLLWSVDDDELHARLWMQPFSPSGSGKEVLGSGNNVMTQYGKPVAFLIGGTLTLMPYFGE